MKKTKQQNKDKKPSCGLRIDPDLLKRLKILAIKRDCKPNALAEEGILLVLEKYEGHKAEKRG